MAPRWCGNGTLVQESITRARMDMFWGPTWMAEQQDDIVAGLFNFTAVAPIQQAAKVGLAFRGRGARPPRGGHALARLTSPAMCAHAHHLSRSAPCPSS